MTRKQQYRDYMLMLMVPILVVLLGLPSMAAAGLEEAEIAYASGQWRVLRSVNAMTDEVSCTGVYGSTFEKQLTEDALYISVRGGIQGYRVRIDDEPVSSMKLPSEIEKKVKAVGVDGRDLKRLLEGKRLRIEVLTLVRGVYTDDIDLEGFAEAHQNILAGCPVTENSHAGPNASDTPKSSVCPRSAVARLEERGVSKEIIEYACGQ